MSAIMTVTAGARSLAGVVALVTLLGACTETAPPKPEDVRTVRVLTVGAAEAGRRIEYAGEVRARHETRLGFRVGGKIVERLVEVGSIVRAGQAIARLDAADLSLAAASAAAQVAAIETEQELAAAELRRYADLRAKNYISQAEYERRASAAATADSRLEAARAQQRQAANQVRYATLDADTAGVITGLEAEVGQVVAAGQTVARLARPGEKEVVFSVPEGQRALLEGATDIEIRLNARPQGVRKARLRELSPAADPATRTYAARATIVEPGSDVELGMSATASVLLGPSVPRIEIPISALHSRGEAPQVFVVEGAAGEPATVQLRTIRTAGVTGERVVVDAGLEPGDRVISAGARLLRPGQKVRLLDEK
jgi:membrane fusion protein, multidrug efflux system